MTKYQALVRIQAVDANRGPGEYYCVRIYLHAATITEALQHCSYFLGTFHLFGFYTYIEGVTEQHIVTTKESIPFFVEIPADGQPILSGTLEDIGLFTNWLQKHTTCVIPGADSVKS